MTIIKCRDQKAPPQSEKANTIKNWSVSQVLDWIKSSHNGQFSQLEPHEKVFILLFLSILTLVVLKPMTSHNLCP